MSAIFGDPQNLVVNHHSLLDFVTNDSSLGEANFMATIHHAYEPWSKAWYMEHGGHPTAIQIS